MTGPRKKAKIKGQEGLFYVVRYSKKNTRLIRAKPNGDFDSDALSQLVESSQIEILEESPPSPINSPLPDITTFDELQGLVERLSTNGDSPDQLDIFLNYRNILNPALVHQIEIYLKTHTKEETYELFFDNLLRNEPIPGFYEAD